MKIKLPSNFKESWQAFSFYVVIGLFIASVDKVAIGVVVILLGIFFLVTQFLPKGDEVDDENDESPWTMSRKNSLSTHLALGGVMVEVRTHDGGVFIGKLAEANNFRITKGFLLLLDVETVRANYADDEDIGDLKAAIRRGDQKTDTFKYVDVDMVTSIESVTR
ncbi:MAG: hypothetical protein Q8L64_04425 [bacterium]|nr:hypothetical protein [bacterium]